MASFVKQGEAGINSFFVDLQRNSVT